MVMIGFENWDFAKGREACQFWVCLGGFHSLFDMFKLASKSAFMSGDKAHAHKRRNCIAINFHGSLPSEMVQFVSPA
jgi:hypothetical protein